ncbi:hypothetical protein [Lysinibacillus sp. LZ02]|uniref:hypothetical protein n=1 Tax=Lysinibacillus sp. LZ02 TaxID=3420668 RepID=UPI003D369D96
MVDFVIYTPVLYPTNTPDIYYCYAMAVKLVELQNIVNSDLEDDEWTSIENYEMLRRCGLEVVKWKVKVQEII